MNTTHGPQQCPTCTIPFFRADHYENLLLTSPVLQSLRLSNDAPCESTYSYVHADILPGILDSVSALAYQIEGMKGAMERMHGEQSSLLALAARYRAITSPIRRLPPEILSNIFQFACFSLDGNCNAESSHTLTLSVAGVHWAISRVSRYWRETLVSCTSIWSTFNLNLHSDATIKPFPLTRRAFDLALERSGQHPIDILLTCLDRWGDEIPPETKELLQYMITRLCSHSVRWRKAFFVLGDNGETLIDSVFIAASAGFPQLSELSYITGTGMVSSIEFERSPPVPCIRKLCLDGVIVWDFPWSQLTTLELRLAYALDDEGVRDYLYIFSCCTHLSTLSLETSDGSKEFIEDVFPDSPQTVEMPNLRKLSFDDTLFLQYLLLPGLLELRLTAYPIPLAKLWTSLRRLGCSKLTSLHLENVTPDFVNRFAGLELAKTITCLDIRTSPSFYPWYTGNTSASISSVTSTLQALYPVSITQPEQRVNFPQLTSFSLRFDINDNSLPYFADDTFLRMLQVRWSGCMTARLKSFEFILRSRTEVHRGWSPTDYFRHDALADQLLVNGGESMIDLKAIRKLKDEGMRIRIRGVMCLVLSGVEHQYRWAFGEKPELLDGWQYWS